MYVPLPSVTTDIVGQNYKKETKNKYKKRDTSRFIQSIWLKSIQLMLLTRFSFSKILYIIGLVN